ncbi:MAG: hypothetical protein Unbinned3329contig1000_19 [Prokaryotic dsDNA virus sp.]|jgi:hypothetical protein|nr:MAG: hypothetical protein Unbinned3329contig1000_19 [Prokaryotic dsDNA virus sp.]|tara:strand:- start:667 stop:1029 length:363 start_codon:yes stop_codon:yes gene_type:complete
MGTAIKRDPKKWAAAKARARARLGGKHSARAMQLAVKYYKASGGTYAGTKKSTNKLAKWSKQDWGYTGRKGSRYLPKKARQSLTIAEKRATNAKKRADTAAGRQYSSQPENVAKKTSRYT